MRKAAATWLAAAACALAGCSSPPKNESPDIAADRLYREARDDMETGAYDRATKTLERVEGLAAGTLLAQQAQLDLAYVQWKAAERASALSTIERFIKLNPSSPALDYALYLRGMINFNEDLGLLGAVAGQKLSERDQRAARDAWQGFKQLVEQFPQSRYTPDARLRMNYILNSLAEYEVHVARYYFRRGAYVAAANRAQHAVAEYPHAPAAEEALYLMMASYDKLQLAALRASAERVLRRNYPQSAYLTEGLNAYDRPWWQIW
ncbi:MAG: outer membrane protein assembly factor BamD [Rubrivivax sp.]|nr:outer membrane protein assembly factor BamD [Rubrivivax sp.]